MRILDKLEPSSVFSFFEDICDIPHGSGNTGKICDYIENFAKDKKLEYYRDSMNNIIVKKIAHPMYEKSEPVILQGHIDMVCEKEPDCKKDMENEGLDLIADGDFISAKGTTLGADNGIAVAYILAILADEDMMHPPIEAVFTVDEEIGLLGAFGIDVSPLRGKRMLNLDIECEDEITVSCAGGINARVKIPMSRAGFSGEAVEIIISSLSGGHSGVMIKNGGANSHVLMSRLLLALSKETDIRIADINGVYKDNVIPPRTSAVILAKDKDKIYKITDKMREILKKEYSVTDPDLELVVIDTDYISPLDTDSHNKLMHFMSLIPNGVQVMSPDIEGLVQTSLNFASAKLSDTSFEATISVRSSVSSQKQMLTDRITELAEFLGGTAELYGDYPGWEYNPNSVFRDAFIASCTSILGKKPRIEAIHAGLECGLFCEKIPGLDCISYGPNIYDIHTPEESLSISSTQNVWKVLVEFLKNI